MTPDVHLAERAALLNALPMAIVVVDPNGRIAGWNRAAEALYGRREQDALGGSVVDTLFDPDDRPSARELFAAADGQQWDGDFRVQRADGVLLVSSFRLTPLAHAAGWAWIATDHIDQGLAEQQRSVLVQAERAARSTAEEALGLVESILTSAPVGIAVLDLDLRYVRVNEAYAELSRMPAEAHIGGRLGDVVPVQTDVAADLRRVLTTGRIILARNVELHDRTGRPSGRHFSVSYFPVRTAGGAMVGVGLAGIEITEAKRAEAERLAVLRRVEAAQERLSILATASSVLTTTMELDELLDRLTKVLTPA
ncbi:MAG TPA: PAS domain-containing protein, partial [Acidimicrobiales bacterium]|nr:PAS domain-containing protein [Acidimicrobiales bacterium]